MRNFPLHAATQRPGQRRLLLLESDRRSFDELREALMRKGYECEVALDLETARRIVAERRMAAAALNVQVAAIPEEDLIAELRQRWPGMRLILYNGTAEKTRKRRLRRAGADSYLGPGADPAAVVRAIERVLADQP